jgi:polyisoprenyl-phosphate glycosyltransferase
MNKKIELSIVVPVFNEEKNLPLLLEEFKKLAKKISIEFLLVEDTGSTDNTRERLNELAKKHDFIRPVLINERGYGKSIYEGLKAAKGEFIGWTHGDIQTPPKDAFKAYELIIKQPDPKKTYVKGKRYARPFLDKLINTYGMSAFETLVLRKLMYDINAQPNIFHRSFLGLMKDPPKDFSFDLYCYYLAKANGYSVKRFPVFFGKRIYGESAWNTGIKARIKFINRTINFTFKLKRKLKNEMDTQRI